jgi:hypothetical protein
MRFKISLIFTVACFATASCAWGHGFALTLVNDSQSNPLVIVPASEATILDGNGTSVGPQNLFVSSFSGTQSSNGSYGVNHGFAYATGAWPSYTATYNILSPLFFSDGAGTGPMPASLASSGTYVNVFNRDVGSFPGAAPGNVQFSGSTLFVPGYGVSLEDPHELQKQLFLGAGSSQTYGEYGFSYEVSVILPGRQKLTTGPLVDVFATDIGNSGFYSTAPISQQDTASLAIYDAAIAVPESWDFNGAGNFSDGTKWFQTIPNGLGFTVAFGRGVTTAINAPAVSVTIDRAVYAGTLIFDNATTSFTLAGDGTSGHDLVLNNNGVGANVRVVSGNHTISTGLTLDDEGGSTFTIALSSTLTLSGPVAVDATNPTVILNGSGTLLIASPPTLPANTAILINGGILNLTATGGSASIGSGVTVSIASSATLELAGSVSALSSAVNVTNNGVQASGGGFVVTGPNQQIGNIDGSGDLVIGAGGGLTANRVIQDAIVIEGTASSRAILTIAESGSAVPAADGSFDRTMLEMPAFDTPISLPTDSTAIGVKTSATGALENSSVPEPTTLALALFGLTTAGLFGWRTKRHASN